MVCPFCQYHDTRVYNSRRTKRTNELWRRRRCPQCGRQFTTYETITADGIITVLTANNKKASFSRANLLLSLLKVCDHRTDDAAYWLAQTIEQRLIAAANRQDGMVSTKDITMACLETLQSFDTSAFVKYLSYYTPERLNTKKIRVSQ